MGSESREVLCLTDMPSSATEFSTQIESKNFPVVLKDCVRSWPAFRKWDPSNGGLTYMKNLAGYAMVQAMITGAGSNFYGNIRDHQRVAMPFGKFMDLANTYFGGSEESSNSILTNTAQQQENHPKESIKTNDLENVVKLNEEKDATTFEDAESKSPKKSQFYLAQVPISVQQHTKEEPPLGPLIKDISVPDFLEVEFISNINMWMSCGGSRSSTHYDPYHNLLCVVSGRKKVTLWPPSAAPLLYPMPLYSEASNHSAVDFAQPNLEVFPLFKDASKCSWTTLLESGDALYLPEGWYHQVDSEGITLAVNIWWPSILSKELNSHMSPYYLRRVLASLMDAEKDRSLCLGRKHLAIHSKKVLKRKRKIILQVEVVVMDWQ
ncbi:hypothetical protein O6H91_21G030500 [Diphasiastrum complanatum]|uniref:Uncharacterized protein n=1 Tax=Diphasiastrum complanatum TaxID=34168 RepID=A0ACC2AKE4_DIPCM|nr:hypothetical protein O6H91_21G030500 [Diphasiastrum complanatum]